MCIIRLINSLFLYLRAVINACINLSYALYILKASYKLHLLVHVTYMCLCCEAIHVNIIEASDLMFLSRCTC